MDNKVMSVFEQPLEEYILSRYTDMHEKGVFEMLGYKKSDADFIELMWEKQWYEYHYNKLKDENGAATKKQKSI